MYRYVATDLVLARLKLAQGDAPGAAALLATAEEAADQHDLAYWRPALAAAQVQTLLRQGQLAAAAQYAETHPYPLSQARVHLAQGDTEAALKALEPFRQQAEAKDWSDDRLKVLVLQALAFQAQGEHAPALAVLEAALNLAERGGLIRTFVDEGPAMATLLREASKRGHAPSYIPKLLAAFGPVDPPAASEAKTPATLALPEPLSEREREVLALLRTELNGPEMARELSVSLATLRKHTQNIFSKLGVNNRRAAVRRADELAL
jgi:LuxR family transcriptional regulator, maltose regulon positive regulatory protein